MAGTQALLECSSLWVLEAAVMQQCGERELLWFRPSSTPRSCMARRCGHDEAVKDKMSAVVKALTHSSPTSGHCF
jgi:hypothetical protein